ncbi:uncharacterized protein LOC132274181 [Cornus florida]|uniref:uncharacterized protein LOC132274181 n=1 Tax=Cornus florida TaxID=4283 RepID=UPI0028A27F43|nr:uncharacterized protein LOC132274181 [Cornus florida]
MDSNSGSMQSSSGGDEEYDSRTESISPFMMNPSGSGSGGSVHFGSISNPHPPSLPHHQSHHPSALFDPPSHNLGDFSHTQPNPNANTLYNLNSVWSRGLIPSDPNHTNMGILSGLSSSTQSLLAPQGHNQGPFPSSSSMSMSMPMPLRPVLDVHGGGRATPQSDHHQPHMVKNSKKRTRASRRAPTTVLTTDTSNFRQMVQEFTGFPAPPFSASPYSRRLDLFATGSAMRSGQLEPLGPFYPLRPSVQKAQSSLPFISSSSPSLLNSSLIDAIAPTTTLVASNSTNINTLTTNTFNSGNYQPPPSDHLGLDLPNQPQNMLSMQNQMLTFQSLLRSPLPPSTLRYPSPDSAVFGSSSQRSPTIPSLDELGTSHEHVNANLGGFPNHGSTSEATTRRIRSDNDLSRWRDGTTSSNDRVQENLGSFD